MLIKGTSKNNQFFDRKHPNDAGLDIGLPRPAVISTGINVINLEVQVNIPVGYMGLLLPRSSAAKIGLNIIPVPIDPGYTGDIHAFFVNNSVNLLTFDTGKCLVQLVVIPIAIANVCPNVSLTRGNKAFNSSER